MTDELPGYHYALDRTRHTCEKHKTIKHKDGIYVDGDITTNGIESAFSLLKRGVIGTWHRVSAKHLAAYLDEMTFRFNNRKNPYLLRDTLQKLLSAPVLETKNSRLCSARRLIHFNDAAPRSLRASIGDHG